MNQIAKILPVSNIVVDLDVGSKKRMFEQAGLLFENQHGIARATIFDALFAREKLGSTGLGQGIAIPHGRIKGLKEATGALFRLKEPVAFESPDGQPVDLLFILLVPQAAAEKHLQLLSELAQMFASKSLRENLAAAENAEAIKELIDQCAVN
jgi:PTS system nitrogen regulatory IIA component